MSRAISTVMDITVFLLLVGAAAAALLSGVAVQPPATGNPAAEQAELLGSTTASVEYALTVPGEPPSWVTNATARHRRTAHGTLAELLAEAAMSNVTVDGVRLSMAGSGFETAVANTTRSRLRGGASQHAVRVRWEPYRGAPVNATTRVGDRPPPSTEVHAATLTVPSKVPSVQSAVAAETDYEGVATVVAGAVVTGLFPPEQAQLALDSDYPSDRLVTNRYQRMAALTGAGDLAPASTASEELNADLTAALAETVEADMRSRFDSPEDAADSVRTGTVTITVRTWSP